METTLQAEPLSAYGVVGPGWATWARRDHLSQPTWHYFPIRRKWSKESPFSYCGLVRFDWHRWPKRELSGVISLPLVPEPKDRFVRAAVCKRCAEMLERRSRRAQSPR